MMDAQYIEMNYGYARRDEGISIVYILIPLMWYKYGQQSQE